MGFAPVRGFDNDPDAVRIARENACINSVGDAIAFQDAGLPDGLEQRSADLILANIQADVLTANAEAFLGSVNKGGVLCLSGILREECAEVEAHFRSAAARMGRPADFDSRAEGDWCDLCVQ
jgi:ribosomal protein L11 methyltransferase